MQVSQSTLYMIKLLHINGYKRRSMFKSKKLQIQSFITFQQITKASVKRQSINTSMQEKTQTGRTQMNYSTQKQNFGVQSFKIQTGSQVRAVVHSTVNTTNASIYQHYHRFSSFRMQSFKKKQRLFLQVKKEKEERQLRLRKLF